MGTPFEVPHVSWQILYKYNNLILNITLINKNNIYLRKFSRSLLNQMEANTFSPYTYTAVDGEVLHRSDI